MSNTQFEPLYNKSSKGGVLVWKISVEEQNGNGIIITERGFLDGKIQKHKQTISEGKNIGKKNETSPYEQAISEARSKWNLKKTKNGYQENIPSEENTQQECQILNIYPMLAKDFKKDSNKILI